MIGTEKTEDESAAELPAKLASEEEFCKGFLLRSFLQNDKNLKKS